MPVPAQLARVLQRLLGVDVKLDSESPSPSLRISENDARSKVPNGASAVGLSSLEVAFNMCPIPAWLVFLVVLAIFFVHLIVCVQCNEITQGTITQ